MADLSRDPRFAQYARLIVEGGCNLHPGQEVVLSAPVACGEFVHLLVRQCYQSGASDVVVLYNDPALTRARVDLCPDDSLEIVPPWKADSANYYADRDAVYLSLSCPDPQAMAGADSRRAARYTRALQVAQRPASDARMANIRPWCIAAASAPCWARQVYPLLPEEEAVDRLWEDILQIMGVTGSADPVADWFCHQEDLQRRGERLTQAGIRKLRYRSGLGTDFTVEMPRGAVWTGGSEYDRSGRLFSPNMPTEEIFSAPHRLTAEGTLVSSLPLNYQGNLIEGIRLTFHHGKVTSFDAAAGREVLAEILATDEGASYLGEIALVPYSSPIQQRGVLFYSTLFDENASCHFAVGEGYPCLENADQMTPDQLLEAGVNTSLTHVDFMVGTKDLSITAWGKNGEEFPIFVDGEWAPEFR